nr:zinc finger, CCHC-type [Tanacetum cinerariifolium]
MKQPEGFVIPGHESKTKEFLSSKFDMKDLGEAEVILGTPVSQLEYSRAIGCLMYAMISTRPDIAFTVGKLSRIRIKRGNNGTPVSQLEYSRAIGCLMYAMISTRPDIAFTVGKLSRYTSNPSALHCCDSADTLAKAYTQVYNGKSRHLGVRHSMIRELIINGVISVEFVKTQLSLADHLTKGMVSAPHFTAKLTHNQDSSTGHSSDQSSKDDDISTHPVQHAYADHYLNGLYAGYAPHPMIQPHMVHLAPARVPLPLDLSKDGPIYVNAKQYNGILRRRQIRANCWKFNLLNLFNIITSLLFICLWLQVDTPRNK